MPHTGFFGSHRLFFQNLKLPMSPGVNLRVKKRGGRREEGDGVIACCIGCFTRPKYSIGEGKGGGGRGKLRGGGGGGREEGTKVAYLQRTTAPYILFWVRVLTLFLLFLVLGLPKNPSGRAGKKK